MLSTPHPMRLPSIIVMMIAGMTSTIFAQTACSQNANDNVGPILASSSDCSPAITAKLDYLFWEATVPGNDYAIIEDGSALILGSGSVQHVRADRESGFRGQLGYGNYSGWSVAFSYTSFETFGRGEADHPGGLGAMFATQSHPGGNEEALTADASTSFDYRSFDLIFEKRVHASNIHETRIFGGIRWSDIEQRLQVRYDGADFSDSLIEKIQQTTGGGIRMGTETSWILPQGFFLHGQISGGLLFAETITQHFESDFGGLDLLVDVSNGRDRSVPFLSTALGAGWSGEHVSVMVGYELENWFGLHDRSMFVDGQQAATFSSVSEDVLLSGLFVRTSFRY